MTVAQLIAELQKVSPLASVRIFQQNAPHSEGVSHVDLVGTVMPGEWQQFYIIGDGEKP